MHFAELLLGSIVLGLFGALAALEYASVNLVVAVLIWAMVYPMMTAIDFDHFGRWESGQKG